MGRLINIIEYRLKYEREKKGWSQKYIAENTGIPSSNISRYETGERKPDINTLVTLANFLGCSVDYLLGRSDNPIISVTPDKEDIEELLLLKKSRLVFRGTPLTDQDIKDLIVVLEMITRKK